MEMDPTPSSSSICSPGLWQPNIHSFPYERAPHSSNALLMYSIIMLVLLLLGVRSKICIICMMVWWLVGISV